MDACVSAKVEVSVVFCSMALDGVIAYTTILLA